MTTNKGIAEEIINEGVDPDEEEEEEGEEVSLDEELEALHDSIEDAKNRFGKQATKLRASGKTPASKADLADLYESISGDLLESIKDLIGAVASGFQEVASEEEEEEGEEDDTPDDNTVQVYTTLFLNVELFKKLESDSTIPESIRESFSGMRQINEDSLKIFEDQYDAEQLKKLAQERINEAHAKS